jgi:hypothetical protein
MDYRYVLTFTSDDQETAKDTIHLLRSMLPYMVDNVELNVVEVTPDNFYKAL